MTQKTIKRLASSVLKVGESKIWLDPENLSKINEALTRDDIRELTKNGMIKAKHTRSVSRFGARKNAEGKRKGRGKGHGSRKGTRKARNNPKDIWMNRVRAQRKLLRKLLDEECITKEGYKRIYFRIKGNSFSGKANMLKYLRDNKILIKEPAKKGVGVKKNKDKK